MIFSGEFHPFRYVFVLSGDFSRGHRQERITDPSLVQAPGTCSVGRRFPESESSRVQLCVLLS
jgi:hypothetical protein